MSKLKKVFFVLLVLCFSVLCSANIFCMTLDEFINDSRFKPGVSWGNDKRSRNELYNKWRGTGCAAYCQEYVYECWGKEYYKPQQGISYSPANYKTEVRAGDVIHKKYPDGGNHWFIVIERDESRLKVAGGNVWGSNGEPQVYVGWGPDYCLRSGEWVAECYHAPKLVVSNNTVKEKESKKKEVIVENKEDEEDDEEEDNEVVEKDDKKTDKDEKKESGDEKEEKDDKIVEKDEKEVSTKNNNNTNSGSSGSSSSGGSSGSSSGGSIGSSIGSGSSSVYNGNNNEENWSEQANKDSCMTLTEFINDSRFKDGVSWGTDKTARSEIYNKWNGWGAFAYCQEYVYECWGKEYYKPQQGISYNPANYKTEVRTGDVIHKIWGNKDNEQHWFIVLERNGNKLKVAEGSGLSGGSYKVRVAWISNDFYLGSNDQVVGCYHSPKLNNGEKTNGEKESENKTNNDTKGSAYKIMNGISTVDDSAYGIVNGNSTIGNSGYGIMNGNSTVGNSDYGIMNGNSTVGNSDYGIMNGNSTIGNSGYGIMNGNSTIGNSDYGIMNGNSTIGNSGYGIMNGNSTVGNSGYGILNGNSSVGASE